jgi:hypothetical protein
VAGFDDTPPQRVSPTDVAELLKVSPRVVHDWLATGNVPYFELPSASGMRREYRIPLQPLLISLPDLYDLAGELQELTLMGEGRRLTEGRVHEALDRQEA